MRFRILQEKKINQKESLHKIPFRRGKKWEKNYGTHNCNRPAAKKIM